MSDFKAIHIRVPLGQLTALPKLIWVLNGPTPKRREMKSRGGGSRCSWIFVGTWKESLDTPNFCNMTAPLSQATLLLTYLFTYCMIE